MWCKLAKYTAQRVIFSQLSIILSQRYRHRQAVQQRCVYSTSEGNCPNKEGEKGSEKKEVGADRKRGNWQKGRGQELCDWNPPHSNNSNTHAQMMHENPFMPQAGREDNAEKEGGRCKGWMER